MNPLIPPYQSVARPPAPFNNPSNNIAEVKNTGQFILHEVVEAAEAAEALRLLSFAKRSSERDNTLPPAVEKRRWIDAFNAQITVQESGKTESSHLSVKDEDQQEEPSIVSADCTTLYKCPYKDCTKTYKYKSQQGLDLHINSQHTKKKKYQCEKCKKVFYRRDRLKVHLRTHTGIKPFKCSTCTRAYSDRSNYNKHENNCNARVKIKCTKA